MDKGTFRHFQDNPVESWKWYHDRFEGCRKAAPNLVEIHGAARKMRCTKKQCPHGAPAGSWSGTTPCSKRPVPIRAHVLWFDEYYDGHEDYGFQSIQHAAFEATCLVFVYTSFSVGITSMDVGAAADMEETTTKAPMLTLPHPGRRDQSVIFTRMPSGRPSLTSSSQMS